MRHPSEMPRWLLLMWRNGSFTIIIQLVIYCLKLASSNLISLVFLHCLCYIKNISLHTVMFVMLCTVCGQRMEEITHPFSVAGLLTWFQPEEMLQISLSHSCTVKFCVCLGGICENTCWSFNTSFFKCQSCEYVVLPPELFQLMTATLEPHHMRVEQSISTWGKFSFCYICVQGKTKKGGSLNHAAQKGQFLQC